MRSETQPQNCRLMKAVPSSTESIAAPCDASIPRSLQSAGRCSCGIAIGMQQKITATATSAKHQVGRPAQHASWAPRRHLEHAARQRHSGGRRRKIAASGTMTTSLHRPYQIMVCRQPA